MSDRPFVIVVQNDYSCKVELEENLKSEILAKLSKLFDTHKKMSAWLDDNTVSADQREQYIPMFRQLLHSISFIWDLLIRAGVTEKEIREHMEIPF